MNLESLDCNNCGAPLHVPENIHFMRCGHCGSRLKVHRDSTVHYTEVLGQIQESTRELKSEVKALRQQSEVRNLDDAWRARSESLLVGDKQGRRHRPSVFSAIITGAISIVGGLLLMIFSSSANPSMSSRMGNSPPGGFPPSMTHFHVQESSFSPFNFFPLFGLLFIIVGICMAALMIARANRYDREEAAYFEKRRRLQQRDG